MFKTFSAIAAVALIAGALTFLLGPSQASTPSAAVKSDLVEVIDCARQGWPYYQAGCIHDPNENAGRAKPVRLVSADRIDWQLPNHTAWPEWSAFIAELQVGLPAWTKR